MRRQFAIPLALVLSSLLVAEAADVVSVRLQDGQKVIGRLSENECTDEVLVLRLIRGGARREIPWSDVNPDAAQRIRIQLGFEVAEASQGMLEDAVEIGNHAGTLFTGKLMNEKSAEKDGMYILKTSDGERRIRLEDVRTGPNPVQVDALQIFTPLELYQRKLKAKAPESAEDHFLLAEFCRTVGDFEHAKSHYETVLGMTQEKYPEEMVRRLLGRVEKRLANQEAEDQLREVKKQIVFNRFPRAAELITTLKERYADDADLMADIGELEKEMVDKRTGYYVAKIPPLLRKTVEKLLLAAVQRADPEEFTLRKAQEYAGGEASADTSVTHEAVKQVAEKFGIPPEEVLEFYNQRSSRAKQRAFYRDGTFIVVENLEDALAKAPKIKKQKGKKGPRAPKATPQKTPDKWFEEKITQRKYTHVRDFLFAWWAEKSGMTELLDPKEDPCQTCVGKGFTQSMIVTPEGAIPFFNRCQTCHMAKHHRVVIFR